MRLVPVFKSEKMKKERKEKKRKGSCRGLTWFLPSSRSSITFSGQSKKRMKSGENPSLQEKKKK